MQYSVRDKYQILQFSGTKLSESTSQEPNKTRWVEFELYCTFSGIYIVGRKGASIVFHNESCDTVYRNHLSPISVDELPLFYVPCDKCKPSRIAAPDGVFPETARYWAAKSRNPQDIIDALMQSDDNQVTYLTKVAAELLERAAQLDPVIKEAFEVKVIE